MRAFNRDTGKDLALKLSVAATAPSRARGLIGRRGLADGEGLLLRPCRGVHTFLMKFPIDVLFLNQDNRIIHTVANLQPHRMTKVLLRSSYVIELPAGTIFNSESAVGHEVVIT